MSCLATPPPPKVIHKYCCMECFRRERSMENQLLSTTNGNWLCLTDVTSLTRDMTTETCMPTMALAGTQVVEKKKKLQIHNLKRCSPVAQLPFIIFMCNGWHRCVGNYGRTRCLFQVRLEFTFFICFKYLSASGLAVFLSIFMLTVRGARIAGW